ncbi:hypothetical protein OIE66_15910 [Nonomuraea sp. NBC_01738]|uniref:hypothetical protein n=1 Tax=Nonomuraea sp. NBC_01738 TaxID=2976003 RepID=UPI002E133232|nr:hypothetical protein OIE66_15910 [Nonomuraea sp. NBC_01738]
MSRRSWLWWAAAVVAAAAGCVYSLSSEGSGLASFTFGFCPGFEIYTGYGYLLWFAAGWSPLVWYGTLPLIVVAFAVHWGVARLGGERGHPLRPPVETKGWDQVVELPYRSLAGVIELVDPMSYTGLAKLKLGGKGDYRVRVHYRAFTADDDWLPQHILLIVYPGRDQRTIEFKKAR